MTDQIYSNMDEDDYVELCTAIAIQANTFADYAVECYALGAVLLPDYPIEVIEDIQEVVWERVWKNG